MNKIIAVAFAVLMLALALPANAAIQATSVEVRGAIAEENSVGGINITAAIADPNGTIAWSPQNFAGFFYDLKDNLGTENLKISTNVTEAGNKFSASARRIVKGSLSYTTTGQPKQLKVVEQKFPGNISLAVAAGLEQTGVSKGFEGGSYTILGWQADRYVALNGKVDKLSKLIIEHGTSASDKKTLTVGETWDIGDGWTLSANSIDAKATPRQVWLTLSKDGVKKDDKVIGQGSIYTYVEKSLGGETDVPLFLTYVDSVFAGATTDMAQLRYTWAISTAVTKISSSDTYGVFKNANVQGKTLTLKNDDTSVTLTQDSTQDLMGNMKFKVADNATLRFYPMAIRDQPGTYEVRGTVAEENAAGAAINITAAIADPNGTIAWSPQTFAGFFYDLKDALGTENLMISTNVTEAGNKFSASARRIVKGSLSYTTTGQPKQLKVVEQKFPGNISLAVAAGLEQTGVSKGFEGGSYTILGWQADRYVALNGKVDKLSKLIIEHGTSASDKKTLTVGETWDIGDGWTLSANSIDAKATPRQVWLTLSKDGVKKDDKVIGQGSIYTYVEKSLGGETDVPLFLTYVDSVFAGATTDMAQLRYTWAISTAVTKISSSDTYGVFKNANVQGKTLTLKNDDTSVTLTQDSTQDLMGNMKFKVADNATLRFYPMVEYQIVGPGETTPGAPGVTPGVTTPKANVTANVTAVVTTPAVTTAAVTTAATAVPTTPKKEPGFEAVFAVAGLLAVAFLVLRQRK